MENKTKIAKISTFSTILLAIFAIILGYWMYNSVINYTPYQTSTSNDAKVEINSKLYEEIKNPPTYGIEVSLDEPGYGRVNPFSNFKAPPTLDEDNENNQENALPSS